MNPDDLAKHTEHMLTDELQGLAATIEKRVPKGWGFALLMFEFNNPEGTVVWVSNACANTDRPAMIAFIELNGGE